MEPFGGPQVLTTLPPCARNCGIWIYSPPIGDEEKFLSTEAAAGPPEVTSEAPTLTEAMESQILQEG